MNLGQSKLFSPILERIAKHFSDRSDDLVIAKFDATANDAEDEELTEEGFPILVMYHAKTNERVVYKGDTMTHLHSRDNITLSIFRQERF